MPSFYFYVIMVATIFLIIALIIVGLLMTYGGSNTTYPPRPNPCPDLWRSDPNSINGCIIPRRFTDTTVDPPIINTKGNTGNIYPSGTGVTKYDDYASFRAVTPGLSVWNDRDNKYYPVKYTGENFSKNLEGEIYAIDFSNPAMGGPCQKQTWAKNLNITWDGVSNFNGCK